MTASALHPALEPVSFLLGSWEGTGQGLWRRDPPFRYRETIRFTHQGKPFLAYTQQAFALDDGRPLHAEAGYLRVVGEDAIEFLITQPTGFTEIHTGSVSAGRMDMRLESLERTATALEVSEVGRRIWMEGGNLSYLIRIAMNGEPLADHLEARLSQTSG